MENLLARIFQLTLLLSLTTFVPSADAQYIKQSTSGICHDTSSPHYERTQNYQRYEYIDDCLANDGRLPAGQARRAASGALADDYNRSAFRHWIDENRNCINTRHELLKSQSTGPVTKNEDGCRVLHGRWNDPYTGEIFLESHLVDIDHLVPLRWAWINGAYAWSDEKREQFANDERNLFIVSASANRSKGARGPDEWLPPNEEFHCQYVTRYLRILILYDFPEDTRSSLRDIHSNTC